MNHTRTLPQGYKLLLVAFFPLLLGVSEPLHNTEIKSILSFTTQQGHTLGIYIDKGTMACIKWVQQKQEVKICETIASKENKITYAYYLRPGGATNEGLDLNHLRFKLDSMAYDIFENYAAVDNSKEIGITITNLHQKKSTTYYAKTNTVRGSLIDLRHQDIFTEVEPDF